MRMPRLGDVVECEGGRIGTVNTLLSTQFHIVSDKGNNSLHFYKSDWKVLKEGQPTRQQPVKMDEPYYEFVADPATFGGKNNGNRVRLHQLGRPFSMQDMFQVGYKPADFKYDLQKDRVRQVQ